MSDDWGENTTTPPRPAGFLSSARTFVEKTAAADTSRRQDIIHPSEMVKEKWCPRATYLRIKNGKTQRRKHRFRTLNVFDHGHVIHSLWQKRAWDMGMLGGAFHCIVCEWRTEGNTASTPDMCPECGRGQDFLRYDEVPLVDDPRMIHGHADGWIPELNRLIEIKTVGEGSVRVEDPERFERALHKCEDGSLTDLKKLWSSLNHPLASHIRQGMLYCHLAQQQGLPVEGIEYIYDSKFTSDTKGFYLRANTQRIQPLLDEAAVIAGALRGECRPPHCMWADCQECAPFEDKDTSDGSHRLRNRDADREDPFESWPASPGPADGGSRRGSEGSDAAQGRRAGRADERGSRMVRVRRSGAGKGSSRGTRE